MGTPTKRNTPANPPMMKANIVSHSEDVGGLGVADAGGKSILTLIVAIGAQRRKIIARTTSANKLSLSQPDFVIRRPNNLQSPLSSYVDSPLNAPRLGDRSRLRP